MSPLPEYHYHKTSIPSGGIILWSGTIASIPADWALCDGTNGTPNLTDKFIVGAGATYSVGDVGGTVTHKHDMGFSIGAAAFRWAGTSHPNGQGSATTMQKILSGANDTYSYYTSLTAASGTLPPYYALAYIMKL